MHKMGCCWISLVCFTMACAEPPEDLGPGDGARAALGPRLDKADSTDAADQSCLVVLREVQRVPDERTEYLTRCVGDTCTWLWQGTLDIATEELTRGSSAGVLYHRADDPRWWHALARPIGWGAPGFTRHSFTLDAHLFGPDDEPQPLALIPFIVRPDGSRLFDHNHLPGHLESYWLVNDNGHALWPRGGVCTRRPDTAAVVFGADFTTRLEGTPRAGGRLALHYDLERLPECRSTHNGFPAWSTTAFARIEPGGQVLEQPIVAFVSDRGRPTSAYYAVPFELELPDDATSVALWFRNASGAGSLCQTWDSDFGRDFRVPLSPPVERDPCAEVERWEGWQSSGPGCPTYEVAESFEATHCELWLESFGDGYEGHYGIPQRWLEATLRVGRPDGFVRGAGLRVEYFDRGDATTRSALVFGREREPGLYQTGFRYVRTSYAAEASSHYDVDRVAFFVDVERRSGEIVRLWQGGREGGYSWGDAFSLPPWRESIPYGRIDWADSGATIFESARACR
jgi:hypothetical protein